jgi:hypothetical protein
MKNEEDDLEKSIINKKPRTKRITFNLGNFIVPDSPISYIEKPKEIISSQNSRIGNSSTTLDFSSLTLSALAKFSIFKNIDKIVKEYNYTMTHKDIDHIISIYEWMYNETIVEDLVKEYFNKYQTNSNYQNTLFEDIQDNDNDDDYNRI